MMCEPSGGTGCAPDKEYKLTTIRPGLASSFGPDAMFTSDIWIDEFNMVQVSSERMYPTSLLGSKCSLRVYHIKLQYLIKYICFLKKVV